MKLVEIENSSKFVKIEASWPELPSDLYKNVNINIVAYDPKILWVKIDSKKSHFGWESNPTAGWESFIYLQSSKDSMNLTVYSVVQGEVTFGLDLKQGRYIHCFCDEAGNLIIGQSAGTALYGLANNK